MKPAVNINITNLVGKLVVVGDDREDLRKKVTEALLWVLNQIQEIPELDPDKISKQSEAHSELTRDSQ